MRDRPPSHSSLHVTAFGRLWIGIAMTFVALGVVLVLHAGRTAATLAQMRSEVGTPTANHASPPTDPAARLDPYLRALEAGNWDFTLAMTVILFLAAMTVHLPSCIALSRHLHQSRLSAIRAQRALGRLRAEMTQLSEAALTDDATGLPNAAGFRAALDRWLAVEGDPVSVLVLKVDAGIESARLPDATYSSLATTLRDALEDGLLLARLSELEFVILTRDLPDRTADRVLKILDHSHLHSRGIPRPALQIGYAVQRPRGGIDLLTAARSALRSARSNPLETVIPYTDQIRDHEQTAAQLEVDLPLALIDGQITASFQPQICLQSGRLTGVEALARWQHPVQGELSPEQFFPVVLAAGLSYDLDRQVWSHALRQMTHWRAQALAVPYLALNASVETISDPGLLWRLLAQLGGLGLTASDISIEVPEQVFGTNGATDAALNIERLMAAGIRVELDGLGSDLSSIVNLPERGLSGVKLHHALSSTEQTLGDARSVRAMMSVLSELKIPASAKGIETDIQSRRMANVGCVRMQGNLVSAPMDARSFSRWIAAGTPLLDPAHQPAE